MSNRFRKRSRADADLDAIWGYISADNLKAADDLINRIGTVFEMLVQNPLAGRKRSELKHGLRSFPVGNYVIFYVPLRDGIEVLRVISGRQDVDADDME